MCQYVGGRCRSIGSYLIDLTNCFLEYIFTYFCSDCVQTMAKSGIYSHVSIVWSPNLRSIHVTVTFHWEPKVYIKKCLNIPVDSAS